jgi:tetratricopeptide (TPR) repeat protein
MSAKENVRKKTFFYSRPEVFVCLFLIVTTFAVYWQVGNHQFINLDDPQYITKNPYVQKGLTPESVTWAFSITNISYWHPLTWLSLMLDYEFYGTNPRGYHLTNVVLHTLNVLLLFLILKWMTGSLWRSSFVAALFALHPLNVESVAWAVERKNVLSTFFWMLSLLAYGHYSCRPSIPRYLLLALFLALGLMTKPMLVTLPCVLLLLDYWPLGRLRFGQLGGDRNTQLNPSGVSRYQRSLPGTLILEKVPLLVLSGIAIYITSLAARHVGMVISTESVPMKLRIANGLVSYVSYLVKMVWPENLAVFYPYPSFVPFWQSAGAAALLVGISFLIFLGVKKTPYLVTGWLWYLGTLIPFIGLKQVGLWPAMADRFTYVPLIGLFIIVAWGIADLTTGWRYRSSALTWGSGALLAALMILTWNQLRYWKNSSTLFEHALAVTEDNYVAHNNLGTALNEQGRVKEAMVHFTEAVTIRPSFSRAQNNLGNALSRQGKNQEAIGHFYKALEVEPNMPGFHLNLGNALEKQGKTKEAAFHYSTAVHLDPTFAEAYFNLGNLLARQGNVEEAISNFSAALQLKPDFAEAHNSLGVVLAYKGKMEEAIAHFRKALRIKPGFIRAQNNLSMALQQREKTRGIAEDNSKPES